MAIAHRNVNEEKGVTYHDAREGYGSKDLVDNGRGKDQRHEGGDRSPGDHRVDDDPVGLHDVDVDHLHKNLVRICPDGDDSREGEDDVPRVTTDAFHEAESVD